MRYIPDVIQQAARDLRNNSTDAEKYLWSYILDKRLGVRFQRQKPIYVYTEDGGLDRFIIADFYCHSKKLILELDGSIHNLKKVYLLDQYKMELLQNQGYQVLRFTNHDIINDIHQVLDKIKDSL